jgi:hypothetical protein
MLCTKKREQRCKSSAPRRQLLKREDPPHATVLIGRIARATRWAGESDSAEASSWASMQNALGFPDGRSRR